MLFLKRQRSGLSSASSEAKTKLADSFSAAVIATVSEFILTLPAPLGVIVKLPLLLVVDMSLPSIVMLSTVSPSAVTEPVTSIPVEVVANLETLL